MYKVLNSLYIMYMKLGRTFLRILYCKWTSRGHKNKLTMIGAESQKSATGGTLPPLPLNKAALVRNAYQAGKLIGKN